MSLRDGFSYVLTHYLAAKDEDFTRHPVANFVRHDLRDAIEFAANDSGLIFKGSAGQGRWCEGPWVGVFDPLVTDSAQRGYYPVYLFREDMGGLYLSLNQGMTEIKKLYKADAKTALRARAANFRAMLGDRALVFPEQEIDLAPQSSTNDTAFYEAGNICAKYYPVKALPSEAQLVADLHAMIHLYAVLTQGEAESAAIGPVEGDEPPGIDYEDATRFRMHKRIERNAKLAKRVKAHLGYTCQVCKTNFEATYGEIGRDYIEAHHLKPLASLKGQKVLMDPATDFAVLCANCHRMIHRSGCVDDIAKFTQEHYRG